MVCPTLIRYACSCYGNADLAVQLLSADYYDKSPFEKYSIVALVKCSMINTW